MSQEPSLKANRPLTPFPSSKHRKCCWSLAETEDILLHNNLYLSYSVELTENTTATDVTLVCLCLADRLLPWLLHWLSVGNTKMRLMRKKQHMLELELEDKTFFVEGDYLFNYLLTAVLLVGLKRSPSL